MKKKSKIYGFDEVSKMLASVEKVSKKETKMYLRTCAVETQKEVRRRIKQQDGKWQPLSQSHLDSKRRQGFPSAIYTMRKDYYKKIQYKVYNKASIVGFFKGVMNSAPKPVEIALYARANEYGSLKINLPERPLWRPSVATIKELMAKYPFAKNVIASVKPKPFSK